MDRVIVAEVLNRRGDVVQRTRLEQFPAGIGRAWTNDVVLADPTVDAHHARIAADEQGALFIEDLGSVNGLHAGSSREMVRRVPLDGMAMVRVGRTMLRIGALDTPVSPALPELAPSGRLAWLLETPAAIAVMVLAGMGIITLSAWLDSYEPQSKAIASVTGQAVAFAALAGAWAGVWSLIGRLSVQHFRYWEHTALTWLAVLGLALLGAFDSYVAFLFPRSDVLGLAGAVLTGALFVALIAAQLGLVSAMRRRRRIVIGVIVTGVMVALVALTSKAAKNQLDSESDVRIAVSLKALPATLIPATSVDDFVRSTDGLKRDLDRMMKE
ncbi:MAG TPA: FHA domain-containing protein [Gemmatimonadales bacterium]|jgi:hypothetical protein